MPSAHHSIKTAARLSGLSPHLIRMWEKRYGAVSPSRGQTNRRLYSDQEVQRLRLLREVTSAGHTIGNVATLPAARLRALAGKAGERRAESIGEVSLGQSFQESSLLAVKRFDAHLFDERLREAAVALGHQGMMRQVVNPLAQTVGDAWRRGDLTAAHEHFFSSSLKLFLRSLSSKIPLAAHAPRIVIATPAGQLHELGAIIAEDAAVQIGWRSIYLGPNLPAAEIAGAATQNRAAAVALSIVYPDDDPELPRELVNLRRFLPEETGIFVGGRAAAGYRQNLRQIGAIVTDDLDEFSAGLDRVRRSAKSS